MAGLTISVQLRGAGWALVTVADEAAEVSVDASYVLGGPHELLAAATRLVLGEPEARAEFEAEPTSYRWILRREDTDVRIRLLRLGNREQPDERGTEIWAGTQPVHDLARTVIRCFDDLAHQHGEDTYQELWRRPFPRFELDGLRRMWRA